ncbi:MAG: ABC transporter ATP-binding protein [Candidatus Competibacteraceae bacterium]|nr:ABC transporter ATP-binding protein [Candidatus Competibacteraceae bacterium]
MSTQRPIIQIDNVTVRFRIPHERIPTFQEYAIRWLKRRGVRYADFNALNNISFLVRPGETMGIVGPQWSGKSTLLKVIARVIRPTQGACALRGRVAPLLELGAGFDYEMTGRENVFLNGAVLGFSRKDMARRLKGKGSRIVDFLGSASLSTPRHALFQRHGGAPGLCGGDRRVRLKS